MVVRVVATGLNYELKSNAWVEWLPKGNVTVDAALNVNSNNAVSNKAVTTGINAATTTANNALSKANAAIPKTDISQTVTSSGDTVKVPSLKATYDFVTNTAADINTQIAAVRTTANAAIPKSKIAAGMENLSLTDSTQVPSSKALSEVITDVSGTLQLGIEGAQSAAELAHNIAVAAIPKANITQAVAGNTTRQDLVPSAKAVNDAITSAVNNIPKITVDSALSTTSVNPVQNKVVTAAINAIEAVNITQNNRLSSLSDDLGSAQADIVDLNGDISDINTKLTPINTAWGKKNAANGLVVLDGSAKLPANVLPAGYDNVDMLVAFVTANPTTGMTIGQKWYNSTTKKIFTATSTTSGSETAPEGNEKIYINTALNKSYRWTGSDMVVVGDGSGIALGTTSSTAFRGDYGNTLYTNFGSGNNLIGVQRARDFFSTLISPRDTSFVSNFTENNTADAYIGRFHATNFSGASNDNFPGIVLNGATETKAGLMTSAMFKTLQELELQAFPLSVSASISGAGTYEVGSSTTNPISINVTRKGTQVNSGATITVTQGSGATVNGSLSAAKTVWTPNGPVTSYCSKSVAVTYGAQSKTVTVAWNFKYKKYWGVSDKATLANADILAMAGSTWADSRTMGATRFDCTGGKYPYYVIPANLYTGLEMWVGGLKNTDLVVTDMQVTNASGATSAYKVIRLNNKQTGVLSVEFK